MIRKDCEKYTKTENVRKIQNIKKTRTHRQPFPKVWLFAVALLFVPLYVLFVPLYVLSGVKIAYSATKHRCLIYSFLALSKKSKLGNVLMKSSNLNSNKFSFDINIR